MHQGDQTRPRHLSAVPDHGVATLPAPARRGGPPAMSAQRVTLTTWQRLDTEKARELVDQFGQLDAADLTMSQLAFVLGRLHGVAANLLDVLDAITYL